MANRYDKKVKDFFYELKVDFCLNEDGFSTWIDMLSNWEKLCANRDAEIKMVSLNPDWFNKNSKVKDYSVYYACERVYHAIIRYYKYSAVYNSQDKELESALNDWDQLTQQKPNIWMRIAKAITIPTK